MIIVLSQSQNISSCARNITQEILANIDTPELNLTSGTLMELVEVGPRLASLWQIPEDANYTVSGNYSTMILSDYIEISSNLFRQELAWKEMGGTSKMSYSTDLLWTNEHLAHR